MVKTEIVPEFVRGHVLQQRVLVVAVRPVLRQNVTLLLVENVDRRRSSGTG